MAISTWHNLSRRLIYIGGTKVKTMAGVGISICWSNVEYLEFVLSSGSPYSILIPSSNVVMTLSLSFCWGERDKKKNFPHWASVSPMFCKNSHIYTQECISNVGLKRRRICMYIIILLKNEENVSYYSFKKSVSSNWRIVAQVKSIHERGTWGWEGWYGGGGAFGRLRMALSLLVNENIWAQYRCEDTSLTSTPYLQRLGQETLMSKWLICQGDDVISWPQNFLTCEELSPTRHVYLLFICQSIIFKQ